jgi:hypothetical protein
MHMAVTREGLNSKELVSKTGRVHDTKRRGRWMEPKAVSVLKNIITVI